jgi:hypothetical protein
MAPNANNGKNRGVHPKCKIAGGQARELRAQGRSWRQVGRELGIGTATAMRLYRLEGGASLSRNSTRAP